MHADQKSADALYIGGNTIPILFYYITARKFIDIVCDLSPSAKIEVSDAKIGTLDANVRKYGMKAALELLVNIVKYLRHPWRAPSFRACSGESMPPARQKKSGALPRFSFVEAPERALNGTNYESAPRGIIPHVRTAVFRPTQ